MRKFLLISCIVSVALASGCASSKKEPTPKAQAQQQWNQARASVMLSLARDQYQAGSFDKAQKTLDDAMKLYPDGAPLYVLSAKISIEQNNLETAEANLSRARTLDKKDAEIDFLSGVVYQRWQKPETALSYYSSASEKAPAELSYVMARAEVLSTMDRTDDAIALLRGKLSAFEHSAVIFDALGQLLVQQHQYPEAVDMLKRASILTTDDQSIREHVAIALFLNGSYREASDNLTRLITLEINANRADLRIALGECQMQLARYRDAKASFEEACRITPSSVSAWVSLAKSAMQLGDTRRAEISLVKAIALDPGSADAHLMMGYLRLRQQQFSQAMTEFRRASALDSGDTVSLCMVGYALEKLGRNDDALRIYAQALKLKPNDELATQLIAGVDLNP